MLRVCLSLMSIVLCVGFLAADDKKDDAKAETKEVKGTITKVDADAKTLFVKTEDGKEQEFKVADGAKFTNAKNRKSLKGGLSAKQVTEGAHVTVVTDADGKVVKEVKVGKKK